jgi:glycosyltransferase involved in cell wall biosynthesis
MPVYQNKDLTIQAVENLLKAEIELIVIDNASTDGTLEYLSQMPLTVIHNPVNLGVFPAVSQGFKIATGDYIAFVCNDMVTHPGNWRRAIEVLQGDVYCVTTKFTHLEMPLNWWELAEKELAEPTTHKIIGPPMPPHPPEDQMMGGWFVMSRRGWDILGDFDPDLPDWYGDSDLWCRFREMGHPVVQMNTLIHHYESLTTGRVEGIVTTNSFQAQEVFESKWGRVQSVIDEYQG